MFRFQCVGETDEWYTPPHVFKAMGVTFDQDVASPGAAIVPWIPALAHITANSLTTEWVGFVWMNAPFGPRNGLVPWLEKFIVHNYGIALVPDRTSAPWWQQFVPRADLVLFASPKIKFINANTPRSAPAQGTCLIGCGPRALRGLEHAEKNGLGTLFSSYR